MRGIPTFVLAVAFAMAIAAGCGKSGGEGGAPAASASAGAAGAAPTAQEKKEAEQIFESRCVTCHGKLGHGDGPGSAALDPKPRNFGDKSWQDSVTNEHIEKIIVFGGAAVGKSPTMPGNPDLSSKAGVVTALRQHIRKLGK